VTEPIKVFIVDHVLIVRQMLANIISSEDGFEVVGQEGAIPEAVAALDGIGPDVILLDASVSGEAALPDAIAQLKNARPNVKIILVTDATTLARVIPSETMGIVDFISKPFKKDTVLRTIREAMIAR